MLRLTVACLLATGACSRAGYEQVEAPAAPFTPGTPFDECVYWSCNGTPTCCVPTETVLINFEPPAYSPGLINGVAGWQSLGAAGMGCAVYDHAVVANSYGYNAFGAQSLRVSNAVTSGCYNDQTFSPTIVNGAGETSAIGAATGVRQPYMEIELQVATATPGVEQAGLRVETSLDHNAGRMTLVQIYDDPGGLVVNFGEYIDAEPYGTAANPELGCGPEDAIIFTDVSRDLDRSVPHTVRVRFHAIEGPRNDVVIVTVDGEPRFLGTSWEDLYRYCQHIEPYAVDELFVRTSDPAKPLLSGYGLLFDNIALRGGCACP